MVTEEADIVLQAGNTLGEGPLWHPVHKMLYWVDIEQKVVHGWEPHTKLHRCWPVGKRVSTIAPLRNGKLILGLQGEISEMDPATGFVTKLLSLETDVTENRCNDGKCDAAGRFWVGTMDLKCRLEAGSLFCIDADLTTHKVLDRLTIANGMGWSPDGRHMYFIDSAKHAVKRYRFSLNTAALGEEKTVLQFDDASELPDGMCVDREGNVWIGFWGGSRVGCYDPETREHLLDIKVPAPHVTSCCFGGADLKTLYITTAREGLTREQLQAYPLSGSVFSVPTKVPGQYAKFFGAPDSAIRRQIRP